METYNRVMAEQTAEDREKFEKQQKKVAHFNKYLKERAISKVGVMKTTKAPALEEPKELTIATNEEESLPMPPVSASSHAFSDL